MILIFCPHCQEARSLSSKELRSCSCGKSQGRYTEDGTKCQISEAAIPLGIANDTLRRGMENRPQEGLGFRLDSLVLPYTSPLFEVIS